MMEPEEGAVSAAFQNVLILERIMKHSDFEKLKELRLVNRFWNETASVLLRKSCKVIIVNGNFVQFDSQVESCLPNRDIIAKLPVQVTLRFKNGSDEQHFNKHNCKEFLEKRFARAVWLDQIVVLLLGFDLSIADINLFTLFVLHHLPCLKKLRGSIGFHHRLYLQQHSFTAPSLAADAKFKLEDLEYGCSKLKKLNSRQENVQELDPTFLRHCQNLKMIAFEDKNYYSKLGVFLGFYSNWKKMVEENPQFHRIPQLKFDFEAADPLKDAKVLEALIDFINLNQPTWLDIKGDFARYNSILYPKIGLRTPSIRYLKMPIPVEDEVSHADSALRMLTKCPSFAQLNEIFLKLEPVEDDQATGRLLELDQAQFRRLQVLGTDQLVNVVNLTLKFGSFFISYSDVSVLQQVAPHLPNVTRLKLILSGFVSYVGYPHRRIEYNFLDEILNECKGFPRLEHLCFNVDDRNGTNDTMSVRANAIIKKRDSGGFFHNLSAIESLKKVEISISVFCTCWSRNNVFPYTMDDVFVALFYGYEPHVPIQLNILNAWTKDKSYRCKFTPEQLNQKLKGAVEEKLK